METCVLGKGRYRHTYICEIWACIIICLSMYVCVCTPGLPNILSYLLFFVTINKSKDLFPHEVGSHPVIVNRNAHIVGFEKLFFHFFIFIFWCYCCFHCFCRCLRFMSSRSLSGPVLNFWYNTYTSYLLYAHSKRISCSFLIFNFSLASFRVEGPRPLLNKTDRCPLWPDLPPAHGVCAHSPCGG